MKLKILISILVEIRVVSLLHIVQNVSGAHLGSYSMGAAHLYWE